MKKLPVGIQNFDKIRSDDYYYVDKTWYVHHLASTGSYYFLARPRRFGKSLFLDTLKQAFSGNRACFTGLYLEHHWNWDESWPVIHLSFGTGVLKNRQELDDAILSMLREQSRLHGLFLEESAIAFQFRELIIKLHDQEHRPVVVLMDEYDKPLLDNIGKVDISDEMREGLRNFYSAIKDCDRYLKFVFLTGISKFSKVSLFSVLNNLEDISLNPDYGAICGYTQDELLTTFADRLTGVNLQKLKKWYNGFNFLGAPVYNPFDILLFLKHRTFRNYWFETGTPTFLMTLLLKKNYPAPRLECAFATDQLLGTFDTQQIEVESLLFQTGYLTIGSVREVLENRVYTLVYPNDEVKQSLTDFMLGFLIQNIPAREANKMALMEILMSRDMDPLRELFHRFFAAIPNDWHRKNDIARYEGYYASIFYCYFAALGLDVTAEDATSHGRIDLTVRLPERIFILEFKVVDRDTGHNSALEQIRKKAYHDKYRCQVAEIYLIGVEFNRQDRNIIRFDYERVCPNRMD